MTVPTTIDLNAPVIARHHVEIRASLDALWALHQDVNAWPTWQNDISAAPADGSFMPGNSFTWTSFGFTVTSTIYDVTDQARVLWGGTGDRITGIHEWIFEPTPHGVRVSTNESFAGDPVEADPDGMQAMLDTSLVAWLDHLRVAARRKWAPTQPRWRRPVEGDAAPG